MTLKDTKKLMDGDYRDRFRAEFWQLKIRTQQLQIMIDNMDDWNNELFEACEHQLKAMREYLRALMFRAEHENINLNTDLKESTGNDSAGVYMKQIGSMKEYLLYHR